MKYFKNPIIQCIILMGIITALLVIAGSFVLQQSIKQMDTFRIESRIHLGTDNFKVELHDEYMVAITPDGNRWPTQTQEDQYWNNKLISELKVIGICVVFALIILGILSAYSLKHQSPVSARKSSDNL